MLFRSVPLPYANTAAGIVGDDVTLVGADPTNDVVDRIAGNQDPATAIADRRCAVGTEANVVTLHDVAGGVVEEDDAVSGVSGNYISCRRCRSANLVIVRVFYTDSVFTISQASSPRSIRADVVVLNRVSAQGVQVNPSAIKALDYQTSNGTSASSDG